MPAVFGGNRPGGSKRLASVGSMNDRLPRQLLPTTDGRIYKARLNFDQSCVPSRPFRRNLEIVVPR
jgi:hypothetical protein